MRQDPLTLALYESYHRAGKETKFWASRFLQSLKRRGGLEVAKRILANKTDGGITKGFLALKDAGRPDLSVEAIVLAPEFRHLFSDRELTVAEDRLRTHFPPAFWRKQVDKASVYPEALPEDREYFEGAVAQVLVNRYERDKAARDACLAKNGSRCKVCGLLFSEQYGSIGDGFIHVHHTRPLATMRKEYQIDPQTDLVPVCPNCHAMLHTCEPPLSIEELKAHLISQNTR